MGLRILLIEDSAVDVELIQNELSQLEDEYTLEVVETKAELRQALKTFQPDIVLSDYFLPRLDGHKALALAREMIPDIPFIIVTGSVNEETAADCIKSGASDYVTKEHLGRLVPAIQNAILVARRQKEVAMRDAILHIVNEAAHQFLKNPSWENSIQHILEELGQAAGVHRAYLFQNSTLDDGTVVTSQRFEWVMPPTRAVIDNPDLQNIPMLEAGFGRWLNILQKGRPVYGAINTFPAAEQELLSSQDIVSLLVVPIHVHDQLWGFIGFDDCQKERVWETAIIEALYTAANTLGAAISRERIEQKLRLEEKKYADLYHKAPDLYDTIDRDGYIVDINETGARMLGYTREELIGQHLTTILAPETREHFHRDFPRLVEQAINADLYGTYQCKDGTLITFHLKNTWELDEEGRALFSHGVGRDITADIKVREQNRKLSQSVEQSPVCVAITDREGHFEYVNPKFEKTTGYSASEILGRTPRLLKSGVHKTDFYEALWTTILQGKQWQGEICNRRKSGELFWESLNISPLMDENGNITHFIALFTDVSKRREQDKELQTYRRRLEELVEIRTKEIETANQALQNTISTLVSVMESPDDIVIFSLDRNYCYTSFNELHKATIKKIWGADIAIGMNMLDVIKNPKDRKKAKRNFDRALQGEKFILTEKYGKPPNRFYYEDRYNPIIDDQGKVNGLTVFLSDITERKKAEAELKRYQTGLETMVKERTRTLKESEQRYRSLIDTAPLGIAIHQKGKWVLVNRFALRMLGYKRESEMLGKPVLDFIHPDTLPFVQKRLQALIQTGQPVPPAEEKLLRRDGSVVDVLVTSVPIQYEGEPAFEVSAVELTEIKAAQQALEESETRYRSIFENSQDVIGITTARGDILHINPVAETMLGYSISELKKMNMSQLYENPTDGIRFLETVRKKGYVRDFETRFRRKDGTIVEGLMSVTAQRNAAGEIEVFQGIIRDITEQNKANRRWETLRHLARQLAEPLELNEIGPVVARQAYELFEYDAFNLDVIDEENQMLIGLYNEDIMPGSDKPVPVPSHNIPLSSARQKAIFKGKMICLNRRRLPKTSAGNTFGSGRFSRSLLYAPVKREDKVIGILSVQSYTLDKYSKEDLPLLETFANHITGAIRRARQRKILMDALKKAQEGERTKSIFLANMSHEIRTPLNSILGFTGIIEDKFANVVEPEQKEWFESVRASGERLMNTVHSILEISQLEAGSMTVNKKNIDLISCLRQVVVELRPRAEERGLDLIFKPKIKKAISYADEYCVIQAISNLTENAIKYTNEGQVELKLERKKDDWKVTIADTGIGISKDYMSRMYTAFSQASEGFTKKYQGIGLGLALTKKYLDLNDVGLDVRSAVNVGTTFILTFPIREQEAVPKPKQRKRKKNVKKPVGISHILVVEDDEMSRRLTQVLLRDEFILSFAESVSEAKRTLGRKSVDLVLLDLSLEEGQDGLTLARWMRRQKKWAKTPIIVLSAHALEEDKKKALAAGCDDFVTKPIMRDELYLSLEKFSKS